MFQATTHQQGSHNGLTNHRYEYANHSDLFFPSFIRRVCETGATLLVEPQASREHSNPCGNYQKYLGGSGGECTLLGITDFSTVWGTYGGPIFEGDRDPGIFLWTMQSRTRLGQNHSIRNKGEHF